MAQFEYITKGEKFAFIGEDGETILQTKKPSMLFDGEVMLKHGDIEDIMPYYNHMKAAAKAVNVPFDLYIVTFDKVSNESCEELNKLLHCTGYVKLFMDKIKKTAE